MKKGHKELKTKFGIKHLIFHLRASHIVLILIAVLGLSGYLIFTNVADKFSSSKLYVVLALLFFTISFSGGSIMNRNGFDIAYLLFFGIAVVFGNLVGLLFAIGIFFFEIYIAKRTTPLDFALEKNLMIVFIQFLTLAIGVVFLALVSVLFGTEYVASNLFKVFFGSYILSRGIRMVLLVMLAQLPAIKVGITNFVSFLINYYLGLYIFSGYVAYLLAF